MGHETTHTMLITVAAALPAGVLLIALAHRLHLSAIMLLLLGGVALGPEGLGIVQPDSLGEGLSVVVSLAVGLILFEGGLSLDLEGFRAAGGVIKRLLSWGVLVTWISTASAIYVIFDLYGGLDFGVTFSLLCGSLVTVTGPTVIAPILKRIRVQKKLHNILHWEGVLIDPIGVFLALLCFEFLTTDAAGSAVMNFVLRFAAGIGVGLAGGFAIAWLLRTRLIAAEMVNIVALGLAVLLFGVAEEFFAESGLLAVTIAGFVLGAKGPEQLKKLREFKAEITELMIGLLFILLAANLELDNFARFGPRLLAVVAVVAFVVRPLNVLVCSFRQGMSWQERAFLSWVAPRGIVAASLGSIVALTLTERGQADRGVFAETFTYSVIFATVLLQGPTAGTLARWLGLRRPTPRGWIIVGAHRLSWQLARFIRDHGNVPVLLVDSNGGRIAESRARQLPALAGNAMEVDEIMEHEECFGIGNMLALTDNTQLNVLLCQRWEEELGRDHVFRWGPAGDESLVSGAAVWPNLPKPSLLGLELTRGGARLFTQAEFPATTERRATALLGVVGPDLVADPAARAAAGDTVGATLFLTRRGGYLVKALRRDLITRLETAYVSEMISSLVDLVAAECPGTPRDELMQQLENPERVLASMLGHGVAAPHVQTTAVDDRICAVAQIPAGLDMGAPDGEPVRLVFLLVSPVGDPEGHLATLAEMAARVATSEQRERLISAGSSGELMSLLLSEREADDTGAANA